MNAIQIEKILYKHAFTKNIFKAVLAFDELPKKIEKPSAYIINTHTRDKEGEHWLAVFFLQNGNAEFFDSFGLGPRFYGLDQFLIKTSKTCFYNTLALQSLNSQYCGFYCVLFILIKCKQISFFNFLNYFNEDTIKNDKEIENLIQKFY